MAASASDAPAATARARTLRTVSPAPVTSKTCRPVAPRSIPGWPTRAYVTSKLVGDQAFVVIGKHQYVNFLERGKKQPQKFFLGFRAERLAAFVIHANHLLVPRDDPRFHRGDAFRIG